MLKVVLSLHLLVGTRGSVFHFVDVCSQIVRNSVCLDSGMCSRTTHLTCEQAYIIWSEPHLIRLSEPPIVVFYYDEPAFRLLMDRFHGNAKRSTVFSNSLIAPASPIPGIIKRNQNYDLLLTCLIRMDAILLATYPLIQSDWKSMAGLIRSAINIAKVIVAAEQGNWRLRSDFAFHFASLPVVVGINNILRSTIRYLYSLDRTLPLRKAILTNLIPYIHAWIRVHKLFTIPCEFSGAAEYLELLTAATQYDPLYDSGQGKSWIIKVIVPEFLSDYLNPLPIIADETEFPLNIFDSMDSLETSSSSSFDTPDMEGVLMTIVSEETFRDILYFMRNHPAVTAADRARYCDRLKSEWMQFIGQVRRGMVLRNFNQFERLDFLELVRLCGRESFTLEERVYEILPVVLGELIHTQAGAVEIEVHDLYKMSESSNVPDLIAWRCMIQLGSVRDVSLSKLRLKNTINPYLPSDHVGILNYPFAHFPVGQVERLKDQADTSRSSGRVHPFSSPLFKPGSLEDPLIGIGTSLALLMLEGDPLDTIRKYLTTTTTTTTTMNGNKNDIAIHDFYMHSKAIRKGFCKVVDCVVFETLFDNTEILALVDLLKTKHNVFATTPVDRSSSS